MLDIITMNNRLSNRIKDLKPSPTFAINSKAKALRLEGKDVISMGVGEPDFNTPDIAKAAAIAAIESNQTRYTPVDGTPTLKEAIIQKFSTDNQLTYVADEIIACTGAKQPLFNACQALLNPGDEAIIPTPFWVSYAPMVEIAGGEKVFVNADISQHFKITPKQLEAAITDKTRLLFLNSPSNPSGMVYSLEELKALAEVLRKHHKIVILSDDIYEKIIWEKGTFCNILNAAPDLKDRTVIVNGASKAYAMTGWRLGYAAGPRDIINGMKKLQSHATSNPCSITQAATVAALTEANACIDTMVQAYKERHDFAVAALNTIPGITCLETDGTFYLLPNIETAMKKLGCKTDVEFSERLLNEALVAAVPGSAFGANGCIRLSIALSLETLKTAIERIKNLLA